MASCT